MLLNTHIQRFPRFPDFHRSLAPTNSSVAFWSPESKNGDSDSGTRAKPAPIIYAVDDMPCLTELYGLVLGRSGYVVKGFHDRRAALNSLCAAQTKPVLLITDLQNPTMRIEPFLEQCVAARPGLRILLVTGFGYHRAWCFSVKPDRFLPKPFAPEELRETVEAMLAGKANCIR
jgi:DNA-binding NtrC family response regulator